MSAIDSFATQSISLSSFGTASCCPVCHTEGWLGQSIEWKVLIPCGHCVCTTCASSPYVQPLAQGCPLCSACVSETASPAELTPVSQACTEIDSVNEAHGRCSASTSNNTNAGEKCVPQFLFPSEASSSSDEPHVLATASPFRQYPFSVATFDDTPSALLSPPIVEDTDSFVMTAIPSSSLEEQQACFPPWRLSASHEEEEQGGEDWSDDDVDKEGSDKEGEVEAEFAPSSLTPPEEEEEEDEEEEEEEEEEEDDTEDDGLSRYTAPPTTRFPFLLDNLSTTKERELFYNTNHLRPVHPTPCAHRFKRQHKEDYMRGKLRRHQDEIKLQQRTLFRRWEGQGARSVRSQAFSYASLDFTRQL